MIKRWLWVGAGIAAGLGVLVRVITTPAVATPPRSSPSLSPTPQPSSAVSPWQELWTVPVPGVIDAALSPDGTNIAWTDSKGFVRRILSDSGRTLWRTKESLTGVNRLVAGSDGSVAAFSRWNPERNSVVFLHPQFGDSKSRIFAGNGAVWSAAFGAKSTAYIGTGGRTVYEVDNSLTEKTPLPTDGMPESLVIDANNTRIALGTWSRAGVMSCSLTKHQTCWRRVESQIDRLCRVSLSADGSRVLVLSTRGAKETEGIVRVHDGDTGALLWEVRLPDNASQPIGMISGNGAFVAVTYRRGTKVENSDDWRLAYFDAKGNRLFADKGSALFKPVIAAIAEDGSTLTVRNGSDTLFMLDQEGNFIAKKTLSPDPTTGRAVVIKTITSSYDGKSLLIERRDGYLTLLRTGG